MSISNKLSGLYDPLDVCCGYHRYKKRGVDYYLEYCQSRRQWQLKPGVHKDKDTCCKYHIE